MFTIFPAPSMNLTVEYFDIASDLIDLQAFSVIGNFSELRITAGSAMIHLPDFQLLRLLNLQPSDMRDSQFLFAIRLPSNDTTAERESRPASPLDPTTAAAIAIVAAVSLFVLLVFLQSCRPVWRSLLIHLHMGQLAEECSEDVLLTKITFLTHLDGGKDSFGDKSSSSSSSASQLLSSKLSVPESKSSGDDENSCNTSQRPVVSCRLSSSSQLQADIQKHISGSAADIGQKSPPRMRFLNAASESSTVSGANSECSSVSAGEERDYPYADGGGGLMTDSGSDCMDSISDGEAGELSASDGDSRISTSSSDYDVRSDHGSEDDILSTL